MTHRVLTRPLARVVLPIRSRQRSAALLAVIVMCWTAACSTTATYTHPSGLQATCVRPANYPGSGLLGLLTSPLYAKAEYDAATQYAQCKTAYETHGWIRTP